MCGERSGLETIGNVLLQAGTIGLVGVDEDGLEKGAVTKGAISGLKEVTGAKAAEEANEDARARLAEEKKKALQDRENAKAQSAREQVQLSRGASAVRSNKGRSTIGTSQQASDLGGNQRDFLGL